MTPSYETRRLAVFRPSTRQTFFADLPERTSTYKAKFLQEAHGWDSVSIPVSALDSEPGQELSSNGRHTLRWRVSATGSRCHGRWHERTEAAHGDRRAWLPCRVTSHGSGGRFHCGAASAQCSAVHSARLPGAHTRSRLIRPTTPAARPRCRAPVSGWSRCSDRPARRSTASATCRARCGSWARPVSLAAFCGSPGRTVRCARCSSAPRTARCSRPRTAVWWRRPCRASTGTSSVPATLPTEDRGGRGARAPGPRRAVGRAGVSGAPSACGPVVAAGRVLGGHAARRATRDG